jgi:uncharacterized damage-inducible protein DinB
MPNPLFEHLRDLHNHMAWADAVWFQVWGQSDFIADEDLLQRTQHTADVQAAFLMVLKDEEVLFPPEPPQPSFQGLQALAQANHDAFFDLFRHLDPGSLGRTVGIPWFSGTPCQVTVAQALTQVAMHTQHHRGQLMGCLKYLGGNPRNVDYILWACQGRPAPSWLRM